jgi:hypothetical protein
LTSEVTHDQSVMELKQETDIKLEMMKQEVSVICVLCGQEGHMGKDCREVVCILCCARGHLMDQCGDITVQDEEFDETTSVSELERPAATIRLKNLNDLLEMKEGDKSVSLEESSSPVAAVPTTKEESDLPLPSDDEKEERFHKSMVRKFSQSTPPDVIALFRQKYCGLCCIKFSCERFASKHYDGRGHDSLIRKKTFRNRPLFWQMVFHALISVEPRGATEEEIFQYILETFSAHLNDDTKQVRAEMINTIRDMVGRFHNVVKTEGVYRLRDRKPSDAPKPVPEGLVEKKKGGGTIVKDQKPISFGFSNFQRHLEEKKGKDRDVRRSGSKDLVRDRDRSRDSRRGVDSDRRHRREERSSRGGDRSRDIGHRKSYRDRSSSRDRSSRRSSCRKRLRSSHRRSSSPKGEKLKTSRHSDSIFSSLESSRSNRLDELPLPNVKSEFSMFLPNSMSIPQAPQNYFTSAPLSMNGGYPFPTFMTLPAPGTDLPVYSVSR